MTFSSWVIRYGVPLIFCWAASGSHEAPAPSLAAPAGVQAERQNTLAELWQRKILSTDLNAWSPEDMETLRRLRNAEAMGALEFLRDRFKTVKGFVVEHRPMGSKNTRLRLTKPGFDRYLFAKSQEALRYFDRKGVEVKWAFSLKDLDGHDVFANGLLTEEGDILFTRLLNNKPAFWRTSSGQIGGNRPPPKSVP